jgi:hypothetical protein
MCPHSFFSARGVVVHSNNNNNTKPKKKNNQKQPQHSAEQGKK